MAKYPDKIGMSWGRSKKGANNRLSWLTTVQALCPPGDEEG